MIQKNRSFRPFLLAALLCGASTASLLAQGPNGPRPGEGPEGHGGHHGPPPSPLFDALDTNHDGVISAEEITNASTSLKGLLKDGATELKRDDLRPARPAVDPADADAARPHHEPPAGKLHRPPPPDGQAAPDGADHPDVPPHPDAVRDPQAHGPEGHGPRHHGPPPSPLFDALDTNHDGAISAEEMAAASTSLKGLLKTGTTELRREDLRPAHPLQREEQP